jgi:hypothetical protein
MDWLIEGFVFAEDDGWGQFGKVEFSAFGGTLDEEPPGAASRLGVALPSGIKAAPDGFFEVEVDSDSRLAGTGTLPTSPTEFPAHNVSY